MRVLSLCLLAIAFGALVTVAASDERESQYETGRVFFQNAIGIPQHLVGSSNTSDCLVCTLVVGIFESIAEINGTNGLDVLESVCSKGSWIVKDTICPVVEDVYKDALAAADEGVDPDVACRKAKVCAETNQCTLWTGAWPGAIYDPPVYNGTLANIDPVVGDFDADIQAAIDILVKKQGVKEIEDHIPVSDVDGDFYSTKPTLRGSNWRGKDCDDINANVYPGRKNSQYSADIDHNCNGISGTDPVTGKSYEELFCADYPPMGMATLGDSATAHFSIPQRLLNPTEWAKHALDDEFWQSIINPLENEFDWPECSAWTGYESPENCPSTGLGYVSSIASRLRERNLCSHRDFQNLGTNGARTSKLAKGGLVLDSLARDQQNDQPLLLFVAMVGNDVCNKYSTVESMTSVAEFEANILSGLTVLDTKLPQGSKVVFVPLAHGTLLYETTHTHTHPIGVKYPAVYDLLNCNVVSPCAGWLNSDAATRNATQAHADALSAVYPKIMASHNYTHFDMATLPGGWTEYIFTEYADKLHGPPKAAIEPSDGFHPSQTGNMMQAEYIWNWLETEHPDFLGPINPNNDAIMKMFGNQGGF